MTAQGHQLLAQARLWIGTPVRHQHAIIGFGVDCWHLVREVGTACGVLDYDDTLFDPFRAYGEQPSPRLVLGACRTFLASLEPGQQQVGDVACIAWRSGLPMHLAILGEYRSRPTLVHAHGARGRVVEHGFTAEWPRLVDSWWRYPGAA